MLKKITKAFLYIMLSSFCFMFSSCGFLLNSVFFDYGVSGFTATLTQEKIEFSWKDSEKFESYNLYAAEIIDFKKIKEKNLDNSYLVASTNETSYEINSSDYKNKFYFVKPVASGKEIDSYGAVIAAVMPELIYDSNNKSYQLNYNSPDEIKKCYINGSYFRNVEDALHKLSDISNNQKHFQFKLTLKTYCGGNEYTAIINM